MARFEKDLRVTAVQDHGFELDRVRDWLGHASVIQTEGDYAFLRTEDLHAAIDAGKKQARGARIKMPLAIYANQRIRL